MGKGAFLIALLAGATAPAAIATAQAPAQAAAASPVTALFEAANRGEAAVLERALADPATGAELRALLRARLAAGRLNRQAGRDPALARLAESATDPALRRAALTVLTSAAFTSGDYGEAARSGRLLAAALIAVGEAEQAAGVERTWRLAELLAGQPRQSLQGRVAGGSTSARIDPVGLPRIDVAINGQPQDAIFDTGANLSVLSTETARRLGVRIVESTAQIGNSVQSTVAARIGIADRLEIAGTTLRNVTFLIIDDAQMSFPLPTGRYEIKAIIGVPVMRALGRMRMEPNRLSVLPAESETGVSNMRASVATLYVDASVDGRPLPLLLDTGATQTALGAHFAEVHPSVLAGLTVSEVNAGGAGGTQRRRIATWRDVPVELAGRRLRMPAVPITLPGERRDRDSYGTIGSNLLRAFQSYTLDFNAMRFELGAPVPPPAPASGSQ